MAEILFRYLHFMGIVLLSGALIGEHLLLTRETPSRIMRKLVILDVIYGISAMLVLGAGLTLWFGGGKPAAFYNANPVFHLKISLFLVIALLSIKPTLFFLKHRKVSDEFIEVPRTILNIVRVEVVLLLLLPLLASRMARGVGL